MDSNTLSPKISPGLIVFKGPFLFEGLIFGGAYVGGRFALQHRLGKYLEEIFV